MKKNKIIIILLLIAAFCWMVILAVHRSLFDPTFTQCQFDDTKWRQGNLRIRGEMVRSLQDKNIIIGMSRNKVLEMLGRPDEDYTDQLRYKVDVGRRIGGKMFPEILIIELDDKTNVEKCFRVD